MWDLISHKELNYLDQDHYTAILFRNNKFNENPWIEFHKLIIIAEGEYKGKYGFWYMHTDTVYIKGANY
jgi:hypothetical protein